MKGFNYLRGLLVVAAVVSSVVPTTVFAGECKGSIFNPVTDVAWTAMFPIRVGGVKLNQGALPDAADSGKIASPVCTCTSEKGTWVGMDIGFWDVNNLVEAVETPGCSTVMGKSIAMNDRGFHGGTSRGSDLTPLLFKQAHWIKFPVISILNMLTDMKCVSKGSFDYVNLSEFDPRWNNDLVALFSRPDNILFAFPAFDLLQPANVLQAHTSAGALPAAYDSLFWLYWDTIYPLSGSKSTPHDLEGSAQIVAKQIYSFYGLGLLRDGVKDVCQATMSYTPKKSHWRFQIAKPVKTSKPFLPGMSELIWGMGGKNPPFKEGNFLFVLFQRKRCCEAMNMGGVK